MNHPVDTPKWRAGAMLTVEETDRGQLRITVDVPLRNGLRVASEIGAILSSRNPNTKSQKKTGGAA